jgi:hypothetical protein
MSPASRLVSVVAVALFVKVNGYIVAVGIADFVKTNAAVDAESPALAKLVLSKL